MCILLLYSRKYVTLQKREVMEQDKKPVGRPSLNTKRYQIKVYGNLVPVIDALPNKNKFINEAIMEKAKKDGLISVE